MKRGGPEIEEERDSGLATDETDEEREVKVEAELDYKMEIVWSNIVKFIILHLMALYSLTLLAEMSPYSWLWLVATYLFSGAGITAGAHRLWSHRTYKAKLPLRLFLLLGNSMAGENSVYTWCRDHRTHHKYSETEADPHNAKRGFLFSHIGWLCVRKHPRVISAGRNINLDDLASDKLVMFQHRHYLAFFLVFAFILPTIIPNILWGESLFTAYFISVLRYVSVLHATWLVNSAAHMFGMKPYDVKIGPVENMAVSVLAMGEGFHNYHHTFPYDYSTSEWGPHLNITTAFIDFMAMIGQAYDLRKPSASTLRARVARTGVPDLTKIGREDKRGL